MSERAEPSLSNMGVRPINCHVVPTRRPDKIRISNLQVQVRPHDYISQATVMALAWAARPGVSKSVDGTALSSMGSTACCRSLQLCQSMALWHCSLYELLQASTILLDVRANSMIY
jgi:hypothetical protein